MSVTLDCRDGNCDACEVCDHTCHGLVRPDEELTLGARLLATAAVVAVVAIVAIVAGFVSAVTR